MSWHLEPQSDLVVELHLMPGAVPEPVRVSVGLYFTEERPSRMGYMLRLGRQDIDIPAGRRDYVNADAYTLPIDVDAIAVQPHAHFLAKDVRAWATLPGGAIVPLIRISNWDFHWQDVYTYAEPLLLPKGTVVEMRYTYDNSAANRANPNRPSQACDVRSNQRIRDGVAVAAGGASPAGRSRAARTGLRPEDSPR
jgi:hypothetical protein